MIEPVTLERWQEAQVAEAATATYDLQNSRQAYEHIFHYLGMDLDQHGKTIAEIGCGPFPAAMFCRGLTSAFVFEPLSPKPNHLPGNIHWNQIAFEDFKPYFNVDEVWLFNVLQHVRDPEKVVERAKRSAPVVRYFEPVDYPTCVYHPHSFTQYDFERWFGDVHRYTDRLPGFFDADCCYGTYTEPLYFDL